MFGSVWDDDMTQYLQSDWIGDFHLEAETLDEVFREESMPIKYDGDLYWSDDITTKDLQ